MGGRGAGHGCCGEHDGWTWSNDGLNHSGVQWRGRGHHHSPSYLRTKPPLYGCRASPEELLKHAARPHCRVERRSGVVDSGG